MRVLQLGKFYPIRGGVEKVMWDIAEGLNVRGIACDMLCADAGTACTSVGLNQSGQPELLNQPGQPELLTNETGERTNVGKRTGKKWKEVDFSGPEGGSGKCLIAPALGKMAATMISPAMVRWLRKHCGEYDIIHVHHPDPMACLALLLSGYKGKVVLHWHSDILKQRFFLKFYKPLQGWLIRRADRIVCTSPIYAECSEALKDVQGKITVIPIGVEPVKKDEEGAESIRKRFEGRKIVFSLGRLVGYKGYSYLVEAASMLPEDYVVVIGGEGPLKEELENRIESLGLKDKVFLMGRIEDDELPAWYGACDVFCLSSIWKTEAFAIVQIEAMSCAKPVVATKIKGSGVSWVNKDGVSGINVEPEDAEGLAKAITKLCGGEYEAFCSRAHVRYESCFTRKGMIDNCLKLYETA